MNQHRMHWQDSLFRKQQIEFLIGSSGDLFRRLNQDWITYEQSFSPPAKWEHFLAEYFGEEPRGDIPFFEKLECWERSLKDVLEDSSSSEKEKQSKPPSFEIRQAANKLKNPYALNQLILLYAPPGSGKTTIQLFLMYHFLNMSSELIPCWFSYPKFDSHSEKERYNNQPRMLWLKALQEVGSFSSIEAAKHSLKSLRSKLFLADLADAPPSEADQENWLDALVNFQQEINNPENGKHYLVVACRSLYALKKLHGPPKMVDAIVWQPQLFSKEDLEKIFRRWQSQNIEKWDGYLELTDVLQLPYLLGLLRQACVDSSQWDLILKKDKDKADLEPDLTAVLRLLSRSILLKEIQAKGLTNFLDKEELEITNACIPYQLHWTEMALSFLADIISKKGNISAHDMKSTFCDWVKSFRGWNKDAVLQLQKCPKDDLHLWQVLLATFLKEQNGFIQFQHEIIQHYFETLGWGYNEIGRLLSSDKKNIFSQVGHRLYSRLQTLSRGSRLVFLALELWGQDEPTLLENCQGWSADDYKHLIQELGDLGRGLVMKPWAEKALELALEKTPERWDIPLSLAEGLTPSGLVRDSLPYLKKALEILESVAEENSTEKHKLQVAKVCMQIGRAEHKKKGDQALEQGKIHYEKALKIWKEILKYPQQSIRDNLISKLEKENQDLNLDTFEDTFNHYESLAETLAGLGIIWRKKNKETEDNLQVAEKFYQNALEIREELLCIIKEMSIHNDVRYTELLLFLENQIPEIENNIAKIFVLLGVCLRRQGKPFEEVLNYYNKAIIIRENLQQSKKLRDPDDLALVFLNRGVLLAKPGEHVEAIKNYTKCLNIRTRIATDNRNYNPEKMARVYLNRGIAFRKMDRLQEAETDFNKTIRLREDLEDQGRLTEKDSLPGAYLQMGRLMFSQGRYSEAEEFFIKALGKRQKIKSDDLEKNSHGILSLFIGKLASQFYEKKFDEAFISLKEAEYEKKKLDAAKVFDGSNSAKNEFEKVLATLDQKLIDLMNPFPPGAAHFFSKCEEQNRMHHMLVCLLNFAHAFLIYFLVTREEMWWEIELCYDLALKILKENEESHKNEDYRLILAHVLLSRAFYQQHNCPRDLIQNTRELCSQALAAIQKPEISIDKSIRKKLQEQFESLFSHLQHCNWPQSLNDAKACHAAILKTLIENAGVEGSLVEQEQDFIDATRNLGGNLLKQKLLQEAKGWYDEAKKLINEKDEPSLSQELDYLHELLQTFIPIGQEEE